MIREMETKVAMESVSQRVMRMELKFSAKTMIDTILQRDCISAVWILMELTRVDLS